MRRALALDVVVVAAEGQRQRRVAVQVRKQPARKVLAMVCQVEQPRVVVVPRVVLVHVWVPVSVVEEEEGKEEGR